MHSAAIFCFTMPDNQTTLRAVKSGRTPPAGLYLDPNAGVGNRFVPRLDDTYNRNRIFMRSFDFTRAEEITHCLDKVREGIAQRRYDGSAAVRVTDGHVEIHAPTTRNATSRQNGRP